ncbi:MAG TPA: hypothetical protein VLR94_07165 [Acidobacteriota bacterium]|nr:hypothetical protein [Acidobacteriota bacterium]
MKKFHTVALFLTFAVAVSCGGYKGRGSPLSPEQVEISDMATALMNDAAALKESAPDAFKESVDSFSDAAAKFQNLCLRVGSNSLEARKAFDQVLFIDAQIRQSPELGKQPEFNTRWQELRKNRLNEIAKRLGYRPEKD